MKKGLFLIPISGGVAGVVAVAVISKTPWDWSSSTKNNTINYCLLIGQTDHNDSAARTGGIRDALGTRAAVKTSNANSEGTKQGKLTFYYKDSKEDIATYTVNELENKVCVSDTGATWDQGTAINISNNWYSKYPGKITMMISNNDGMAEGALFALSRPDKMPIFGYDSNESTVKLIGKGKITGSINSNTPAQAAVLNLLARRILDGIYDPDGTGDNDIYHTLFKGLTGTVYSASDQIDEESTKLFCQPGDGNYIAEGKFISDIMGESVNFNYMSYCHALLVSSKIVYKNNHENFLMSAEDQVAKINTVDTPKAEGKSYNFFQCCYSQTDTYLNSTMNPLIKIIRKQYNIEDVDLSSVAYGNGNDEDKTLNALGDKSNIDAYLINMTKTVNAEKYIEKIKNIKGDDWVKTPIIFYNRQPTKDDGSVDPTYMMPSTNGGNPYVFYIGFDANEGAKLQGEMIQEFLLEKVADQYNVDYTNIDLKIGD